MLGADDGNRTRVFSLGSASKLNASSLGTGCFTCSCVVSAGAVLVRCCAVVHPVERSSRHELGTPSAGALRLIEAAPSLAERNARGRKQVVRCHRLKPGIASPVPYEPRVMEYLAVRVLPDLRGLIGERLERSNGGTPRGDCMAVAVW